MDDRAAIARIREEADGITKQALIGAFVKAKEPLIRVLAEKYARIEKTAAGLEDIHQAGRVGMVKALETWDPDAGALSTWGGWKIRRAVQDLAHTEQPIKLPQIRGTTADRDRIMKAVRANPDVTADDLGIKEGMLERVKKTACLRFTSVDMFGDGDDAPARARRIERRITEQTDVEGADEEIDSHRAARAVIAAISRCASVAKMTLEDVIAGASHALGIETLKPTIEKPRTKKAPAACPTPFAIPRSTLPRLRPLPLPPPRLVAREASVPRLVARQLPRPSPPPPLLRPHLRPLPKIATKRICPAPLPCCRPRALFLPRSGLSCETPSLARKAA